MREGVREGVRWEGKSKSVEYGLNLPLMEALHYIHT